MKKITLWLLLVLAATIFTSCSDDDSPTSPTTPPVDPNAPTCQIMTPENNDGIKAGSTVSVKIKIKGKNDLIESIKLFLDGSIKHEFPNEQSNADDTLRTYSWSVPSNFTGSHKLYALVKDKGGVEGKSAEVTVNIATGTITASGNVTFGNVMVGLNDVKGFTVSAENIQSNLIVTAPSGFEVSENSATGFSSSINIATSNGEISDKIIYVLFKPTEVRSYSDFVKLSGTNGVTTRFQVQGSGVTPVTSININPSLLSFSYTPPQSVSTVKAFTVSGVVLTSNILINAPSGFELSRNENDGFTTSISLAPNSGNITLTTIFVRFKPTTAQVYSGNITLNTTGISTNNIKVIGSSMSSVPQMVLINGGAYQMGDQGFATPIHPVTLSSFYIGKYEVSQAEWIATMDSNPSAFTDDLTKPVESVSWYRMLVYCNKLSLAEGLSPCYTINGSTNPSNWGSVPSASNTAWDAVTCNFSAKGYRLPTEAEWEFAARGGNSSNGYTYSGSNSVGLVAWYGSNSSVNGILQTHTVGTKQPNELGLYDMSGNVWELVWDRFGSYTSSAQTNPTGASTGTTRVIRGGHYYSGEWNYCRVGYRHYYASYNFASYYGFRLARSL